MDSVSMNPYEQQLYTVFKTFDVDNDEALDKSAVLDLCDALQLEDRGAALVNTLFERRADRVTFTQFRNGLLSVLSSTDRPSAQSEAAASSAPAPAPAPPSDEDSSGREVAPKFVFGSKKYGRRSRPQRAAGSPGGSPRAASVSRLDAGQRPGRPSQRARRSASAMDGRAADAGADDDDGAGAGQLDHDRRVDRDQALALCRDLRMDGIDAAVVDRIFDDSPDARTTVGEFFDRLNAALASSIDGAREDDDERADEDAAVASELVVDAWERAGVPLPRRLLLELGFGAAAVRPTDLERALDDEAAALAEPADERRAARPALLAAALALARLRAARARRRADRAAAERDKLRADVAEAERRARLLASDVDETHARLEARLAADLRRAEARHADAARAAADEAAAERERGAALRARLEAEAARRADAEARARAELEAERARAARADERAAAAEARAAAAERAAARRPEDARPAPAPPAPSADDGAAPELRARLEELRQEAQRLRDRNDELCCLLEARGPPRPEPAAAAACGDLSAELRSLLAPDATEDPESSRRDVATETDLDRTADLAPAHHEEKQKYKDLIRELEASLEQMRDEYERCEEYWARKLDDERRAHDDERRAGDERLADLAARIADYERTFAPARALPPIEERAALEAQVADLERECGEQRARAAAELRARDDELRALRAARPPACACAALAERCGRLGASLAEARGAGAREAAALRARAARAEAAVRRLTARLHAADLLVKDLYVENCHLAHRRGP